MVVNTALIRLFTYAATSNLPQVATSTNKVTDSRSGLTSEKGNGDISGNSLLCLAIEIYCYLRILYTFWIF